MYERNYVHDPILELMAEKKNKRKEQEEQKKKLAEKTAVEFALMKMLQFCSTVLVSLEVLESLDL